MKKLNNDVVPPVSFFPFLTCRIVKKGNNQYEQNYMERIGGLCAGCGVPLREMRC